MTAWMSIGYDAGRLGALTGTLTETGGGGATGAINLTGQYAHWVATEWPSPTPVYGVDPLLCDVAAQAAVDVGDYVGLAPALAAALDAVGNATYDVTFDPENDQYTITASGGSVTAFSISFGDTNLARMLGSSAGLIASTALAWTTPTTAPLGRRVMHWLRPDVGGWSEFVRNQIPIEGEALFGSDGSTRGLTEIGSATTVDFVAAWEPYAKIWEEAVSNATTAYAGTTWQAAFQRARCAEPIWISPPQDLAPYTSGIFPMVIFLRPDSAHLAPRMASADFQGYMSIPIGAFLVGEGRWSNQV